MFLLFFSFYKRFYFEIMKTHKVLPHLGKTFLLIVLLILSAITEVKSSENVEPRNNEDNLPNNFFSRMNSALKKMSDEWSEQIKNLQEILFQQDQSLLAAVMKQNLNLQNQIQNLQKTFNEQSKQLNETNIKIKSFEATVLEQNRNLQEIIVEQNRNFQRSVQDTVHEHQTIMEHVNSKVDTVKHTLSGQSDLLKDLENIITADVSSFSKETCGGVLVGQSGSIYFSTDAHDKTEENIPSFCIWTIRVNNRKNVQIRTDHQYVAIVEILEHKNNQSDITFEAKLTKLTGKSPYIFEGPIVFVILEIPDQNDFIPFELHFEGRGKLTEKQTMFVHENVQENSGNFNGNHIDTLISEIFTENNKTYSWEYVTVVISNLSTHSYLEATFENNQSCENAEGFSLHVITDIFHVNQAVNVDCCKQSCMGRQSIFNYGGPFVVLIKKKYQQLPLNFNLQWTSEENYPSSSGQELGYEYVYKCGGVVGGTNGSISYKPGLEYKNGEKCIWTIIPRPGRSLIEIKIITDGVKTSDRLYMMELTDVNGNELASPKITNLIDDENEEIILNGTTNMLYIVFYTDFAEKGEGFELNWRSSGEIVKMTEKPKLTNFQVFKSQTGHVSITESTLSGQSKVFLITPMSSLTSSYSLMKLNISQRQPNALNNCLYDDISIYTSNGGYLRKENTKEICNGNTVNGQLIFESFDGMAMIVINDEDTNTLPLVDISWKLEYENDKSSSFTTFESYQCGGVVTGDKGVIKYKANDYYSNNEQCIWLLQTPMYSSLSLSLIQDGFENCCDMILVNTINPRDGTLTSATKLISRSDSYGKFSESVLIIKFYSDSSIIGRGFTLRFHGSGKYNKSSEYRYQLNHHQETRGIVSYSSSSKRVEPVSGVKDIVVTAYSAGVDSGFSSLSTNVTWNSGVFRREYENAGSCSYESITFYAPQSTIWLKQNRLPGGNATISCPDSVTVPKINNFVKSSYLAFISIYRRLPTTKQQESNIEFAFQRESTCGEVIFGNSGVISYKEDESYLNKENCIWLIRAPAAKKIRFNLEKIGFEECCDFLHILTITKRGTPVHVFTFQQGSSGTSTDEPYSDEQQPSIEDFKPHYQPQNPTSTIVDGPVAIVIFASDHSVVGSGFRLSYTTAESATQSLPFNYHLKHRNKLGSNRFVFEAANANDIFVAAFSVEPVVLKDKTLKTEVTVSSLRAQRDGNCDSDKLTVYSVSNFTNSTIILL